MEQLPTKTANLDQLIVKSKAPKGTYITLSLLFPPFTSLLALYFSARKNLLYITLPTQTIVFSILSLITTLFSFVPISPPASVSGLGVKIEGPTLEVQVLTYLTLIVAVVGIFLGFYYKNKGKKLGGLSAETLIFLFIFLSVQTILLFYLTFKEFNNLYSSVAPLVTGGYQGL